MDTHCFFRLGTPCSSNHVFVIARCTMLLRLIRQWIKIVSDTEIWLSINHFVLFFFLLFGPASPRPPDFLLPSGSLMPLKKENNFAPHLSPPKA
jgi:hypothetical protein